MKRRKVASLVTDALTLRSWALRIFALPVRAQDTDTHPIQPPATRAISDGPAIPQTIPPRAWELFLRAERCALPLRRRLAALGLDHDLPGEAGLVIATLALEELQRIISARAQLKRLSHWATSAHSDLVLLKGAVAATDDSAAVDLSDIDLWIQPGTEKPLLDWLKLSGHTSRPHAAQHHHAGRLTDQLVSVEVHHHIPHANLDADWPLRVQPLHPAFPHLKRLHAADCLWHILIHSATQHIERRGRIRDVLLLAHAQSFTGSDGQAVLDRARAHTDAHALMPMLEMSRALGSGHDCTDPFMHVAAARYLHTAAGPNLPGPRFVHSSVATTAVLYGLPGCTGQIRKVIRTRGADSPVPVLRWLQRRSPRIGGTFVLGLRIAKRMIALLAALPRAHTARQLARSVDSQSPVVGASAFSEASAVEITVM